MRMGYNWVRTVVLLNLIIANIYLLFTNSKSRPGAENEVGEKKIPQDDHQVKNYPNITCLSFCRDPYLWNHNWDGMHDIKKILPDKCIILIRHGQYTLDSGHLTQLGKTQAELTGKRLLEMNYTIDRMIHSTLDRAVETANIIRNELMLDGGRKGEMAMKGDDMLREGGPMHPDPQILYWSLPEKNYLVDVPRLEAAFKKYFHRPKINIPPRTCTVLVGHGNIFRSFILRSLQMPVYTWMRFFIAHASISLIHLRSDGTNSLQLVGDVGHLPYSYVTY